MRVKAIASVRHDHMSHDLQVLPPRRDSFWIAASIHETTRVDVRRISGVVERLSGDDTEFLMKYTTMDTIWCITFD